VILTHLHQQEVCHNDVRYRRWRAEAVKATLPPEQGQRRKGFECAPTWGVWVTVD